MTNSSQSSRNITTWAMRRPSGDGTGVAIGRALRLTSVGSPPPTVSAEIVNSFPARERNATVEPSADTAGDVPANVRVAPEATSRIEIESLPSAYTTWVPPAVNTGFDLIPGPDEIGRGAADAESA